MNIQISMPSNFSRLFLLLWMACSGTVLASTDGPDYYRLNALAPEAERVMRREPRQDAAPIDARVESLNLAGETRARTIKGRLNGREYVDYQLQAYAGQTLLVSLAGSNDQTYFNLNPPGSALSMFVGSASGNRFRALLPADGIYTVRVYLMRAAARRHESSRYTVKFNLTGKPLVPRPARSDALIPDTPFHASATVNCAFDAPALSQRCEAFVIRRGFDGSATLEVRWPAGALIPMRQILFVKGVPVSTDAPYTLKHSRKGDVTTIYIGDQESVVVPDVLISGG